MGLHKFEINSTTTTTKVIYQYKQEKKEKTLVVFKLIPRRKIVNISYQSNLQFEINDSKLFLLLLLLLLSILRACITITIQTPPPVLLLLMEKKVTTKITEWFVFVLCLVYIFLVIECVSV